MASRPLVCILLHYFEEPRRIAYYPDNLRQLRNRDLNFSNPSFIPNILGAGKNCSPAYFDPTSVSLAYAAGASDIGE